MTVHDDDAMTTIFNIRNLEAEGGLEEAVAMLFLVSRPQLGGVFGVGRYSTFILAVEAFRLKKGFTLEGTCPEVCIWVLEGTRPLGFTHEL